jgi:2-polyprenyl-3-methyl-5-hydroxy-6-metoxy-1,4-benzoquinol methylase
MTYDGATLSSSVDQGTPSTGVGLGRLRDVQCGLLITGELLVEVADLRLGQKVLDVATGSGNSALAGACRFCEVTGGDYSRHCWSEARSGPLPSGC